MFLKEIFSVIAFSFVTLVFSGFAIKVDKFDYAHLTNDKLIIPIENWKKRKLKDNDIFKYFEDGKAKSASIKKHLDFKDPKGIEYTTIWLNLGNNQESVVGGGGEIATIFSHSKPDQPKEHSPKMIKYFVETKSFWANFFC
ncbi:hypothetical protein DNK47_00425 [Mycoplasma wenyonii]|uniref:Uncharacterized protein n=1 Tax=Mycoplasma wenyonii TaxID=65123 RepID=A0A328PV54_9MOLU|nr:hypothetical protein [Mycoplasma wenyonii]RAO95311.1 hypothetical protein DNK47_00425 [Mycoplasma wenyonii]